MTNFIPKTENYKSRVEESFARQHAMHSLGIVIVDLAPGELVLEMPFQPGFTQQHGFMHAGIITTALDSACGYAAFSLMPEDAAVLTIELKTSLLAPADGERFTFKAKVVKPGRTITFVEGTAFAHKGNQEKAVATMTATMMAVTGREAIKN